jgi:hypothetical protein
MIINTHAKTLLIYCTFSSFHDECLGHGLLGKINRENRFSIRSWKPLIPFLMKREKKVLPKDKTVPSF